MILLDPDVHATVLRQGRAALAWEVLRRDPAYQAAYARLPATPVADRAADPSFTADWGLHFR